MAITATDKKYLDAAGVKTLWGKVVGRINTEVGTEKTARETAIGTLTVAENQAVTVENAIAKAKSDLEGQISSLGGAAVKTITVNGGDKLTPDAANNVALTDIASKSSLETLDAYVGKASGTGEGGATVAATGLTAAVEANTTAIANTRALHATGTHNGYATVSEEILAVTGTPDASKTLQAEIDAVEADVARLDGANTVEGSVKKQIKDAVEALDVDTYKDGVTSTSGHVTVAIQETDGKITKFTVADSDIASAETLANLVGVVGITGALAEGAKTVDERLDVIEGSGAGSVAKALVDAKDYADGLDSAMDARVDALEATHATKTVGEGEAAVTVFKTVQEEAAEEVAKVVAEAPEAYDTLKEIAEFIQKNGENGFDAATRIVNLETAVAADTLVVATADAAAPTVQKAINKAVADERATAKGIEDAIKADLGTATVGVKGQEGYVAATGLHAAVEENAADIAALEEAVGTGTGTSLSGRLTAVEESLKVTGTTGAAIKQNADDIDAIEAALAVTGTTGAAIKQNADDIDALEAVVSKSTLVVNTADAAAPTVQKAIDKAVATEKARAEAAELAISTYVGTASGTGENQEAIAATGLTLAVETNTSNIAANATDIRAVEAALAKIVALTDAEILAACAEAEAND